MSTRALADGVMELSRALTEHSRQLKERGVERQRLEGVQAEFHRHLRWQQQRIQALQHDIKRLKNESAWLREKAGEVEQDTTIVSHEIRQCRTEMEQIRREREELRSELGTVEAEIKLEEDCSSALRSMNAQGHKAHILHSRERDKYKAVADMAKLEAFRLIDRIEELAYQLNGLATNQ